ncbi:hypothetical protein [Saccharothrix sp. NRRL B-16348]|uniref:hypothetical protein n=1 Tax=Saccharothrix sp. NRRL B-16348 TaxID=1415542 RepID=UPI0006B03F83|nr:hypothetical protein [Saccharothrix sp. NRRL B-16348]
MFLLPEVRHRWERGPPSWEERADRALKIRHSVHPVTGCRATTTDGAGAGTTTALVVVEPTGGLVGLGADDDEVSVGRDVVMVGLGLGVVRVGFGDVVVGLTVVVGLVVVVDGGTLIPAAWADAPVVVNRVAVPAMSAPAAIPAKAMRTDPWVIESPYK